jgi:hypothetical protein
LPSPATADADADLYRLAHPGALAVDITPAPAGFAARLGEMERARLLMAATPWVSDMARLGVADAWEASFFGDCEDDALAGLEWLVAELRWPRDAFGIMVRRKTPALVSHAVLCAWIAVDLPARSRSGSASAEAGGPEHLPQAWCLDPLADGIQRLRDLAGTWYRA